MQSMLMAQSVESTAYDLLLKGLLNHDSLFISVKEAGALQEAVFIDSREKAEFDVSHIEDAIWVGYEQVDLSALEKVDRSKPLVVYCSVGYRSEQIALKVKEMGFSEVFNLYGGIFEWKNQGKKVVDSDQKETEAVHAYNRIWGVWLSNGKKVYK
jgi:rhodanese-related sulfurtransferase